MVPIMFSRVWAGDVWGCFVSTFAPFLHWDGFARDRLPHLWGSQWHPGYRLALFSYRRALKTRNYLLKHRHRDKLQLDLSLIQIS